MHGLVEIQTPLQGSAGICPKPSGILNAFVKMEMSQGTQGQLFTSKSNTPRAHSEGLAGGFTPCWQLPTLTLPEADPLEAPFSPHALSCLPSQTYLHNGLMTLVLSFSPFHRRESRGSERLTDLPKSHSWQMVNPGLKLRSLRFKTPWGPHALPMPLLSVPCHRDLLFPPHYAPLVILHSDLKNTAYRLDNCPIPDKGYASQPTSVKPLPLELHVQGQFLIGGF